MSEPEAFSRETLQRAERLLCALEDAAADVGDDERQVQFRAATVALRHYRRHEHEYE